MSRRTRALVLGAVLLLAGVTLIAVIALRGGPGDNSSGKGNLVMLLPIYTSLIAVFVARRHRRCAKENVNG